MSSIRIPNRQITKLMKQRTARRSRATVAAGTWILATGFWDDTGVWDDSAVWID